MIKVGYPTQRGGARDHGPHDRARCSVSAEQVVDARADRRGARRSCSEIYIDEKIKDYIVDIVLATREPEALRPRRARADFIEFGASPRASICLNLAARAHAFLRHRGYVTPEDIKAIGARRAAPPRHPHLRGRGRGGHLRDGRPQAVRARRGSVGAQPAPHRCCPASCSSSIRKIEIVTARLVRRSAGGPVPLASSRAAAWRSPRCASTMPGDDVRAHRLERHGAHERAVRQAVHRGARDDRHARSSTCRRRGRFGSREREKRELAAEIAAVLAFSAITQQRPRRADHLHRRGRAASCRRRRASSTCCAWSARSSPFEPRVARHRPGVGARVPRPRRAAARGRVPDLATSWRRSRATSGRCASPRARHDLIPVTRRAIRWRRRCPTSGWSSSRIPRPASVVVFDTGGPEAAALRARGARARSRRASALFKRLDDGRRSRCAPTSPTCRR